MNRSRARRREVRRAEVNTSLSRQVGTSWWCVCVQERTPNIAVSAFIFYSLSQHN